MELEKFEEVYQVLEAQKEKATQGMKFDITI